MPGVEAERTVIPMPAAGWYGSDKAPTVPTLEHALNDLLRTTLLLQTGTAKVLFIRMTMLPADNFAELWF